MLICTFHRTITKAVRAHVRTHIQVRVGGEREREMVLAATWVNTTTSCKYSQVLLMMGKNIAQNM